MKKVSRKKNWKKLLLLGLLGLFLGFLVLVVLEKTKTTDVIKFPSGESKQSPSAKQLDDKKQADATSKQEFLDKQYRQSPNSSQGTGESEGSASNNSAILVSVSAKQTNNTVTILSKIQGVAGGTCYLTISNGSKNTKETAQIIYQPEFSSCAGFSVPVDSVGLGLWEIKLSVNASNGSAEKTIPIEVK